MTGDLSAKKAYDDSGAMDENQEDDMATKEIQKVRRMRGTPIWSRDYGNEGVGNHNILLESLIICNFVLLFFYC